MTRRQTVLMALLGLVVLSAGSAAVPERPRIFWATSGLLFEETDSQLPSKRSSWLGVFREQGKPVARRVTMRLESAPKAITNPNAGSTRGVRVYLEPDGQPLFLLQSVPHLKPGPLASGDVGDAKGGTTREVPITLGKRRFELRYEIRTYVFAADHSGYTEGYERSDESVDIEHRIVLATGGVEQELYSNLPTTDRDRLHGGVHQFVTGTKAEIERGLNEKLESGLLFAGDLDRDGKLDLVLDEGFGARSFKLYLSSEAGPGELVGRAATFGYSDPNDPGC